MTAVFGRTMKAETPTSKLQHPEKLQRSSTKLLSINLLLNATWSTTREKMGGRGWGRGRRAGRGGVGVLEWVGRGCVGEASLRGGAALVFFCWGVEGAGEMRCLTLNPGTVGGEAGNAPPISSPAPL